MGNKKVDFSMFEKNKKNNFNQVDPGKNSFKKVGGNVSSNTVNHKSVNMKRGQGK
jgi:hypothetical protein